MGPPPPAVRNQRSQTALLKHGYTALDPLTLRRGAKNLDGAFGALADLIPPHAFVNLTSRLAQAPPAVRNQSLGMSRIWAKFQILPPHRPQDRVSRSGVVP